MARRDVHYMWGSDSVHTGDAYYFENEVGNHISIALGDKETSDSPILFAPSFKCHSTND